MTPLEQASSALGSLGLREAATALEQVLDAATRAEHTYADMLTERLGVELRLRRERYLPARMRLAHLPFHKTLADFDFAYQPSLDEGAGR